MKYFNSLYINKIRNGIKCEALNCFNNSLHLLFSYLVNLKLYKSKEKKEKGNFKITSMNISVLRSTTISELKKNTTH